MKYFTELRAGLPAAQNRTEQNRMVLRQQSSLLLLAGASCPLFLLFPAFVSSSSLPPSSPLYSLSLFLSPHLLTTSLLQAHDPKVAAPGHLTYKLSWFKFSYSLLELDSKG